MTSFTLILYQSTLTDRPGIQRGWTTAPMVQLSEVSAFRSGFEPLRIGSD
jgi:hypothetical protein